MAQTSPMVVVSSVIRRQGKILVIKRAKPPYAGLLSLPGGKLEFCEHPAAAALREAKEETGLDCRFEKMLGAFSEVLEQPNDAKRHFVMFVAELTAPSFDFTESSEGTLAWINEAEWQSQRVKDEFIASDWRVVDEFLFNAKPNSHMQMREIKISEKHEDDKTTYELVEFKTL